jgi:hypothetical protein
LDDTVLADRGLTWLQEVSPQQTGWNFVWSELWNEKWCRPELTKLGWWWLDDVDADHESWSIVWLALADAREDPARLDAIGRKWMRTSSPTNQSWGFVWPRLWGKSPGDAELAEHWARLAAEGACRSPWMGLHLAAIVAVRAA